MKFGLELKNFTFTVNEKTATFEGVVAVGEVEDRGGDIIKSGAMKSADGKKVPLKSGHTKDVGVATLSLKGEELHALGEINLELQEGKEMKSLIEQYKSHGLPMGMSIGYITKEYMINPDDWTRELKEIEVLEATLTSTPMNPEASVNELKSLDKFKDEFKTEIKELVTNLLKEAGITREEPQEPEEPSEEEFKSLEEIIEKMERVGGK